MSLKRYAVIVTGIVVAWLLSGMEWRSDSGGWCLHSHGLGLMLCSSPGSTDYVLCGFPDEKGGTQ